MRDVTLRMLSPDLVIVILPGLPGASAG